MSGRGRVQNRVAVVTGAGNGLGQAIAWRLAEEGAVLVCGDIDSAGLERTVDGIAQMTGTAVPVLGDVTDAAGANRLIGCAIERFGRVEILVNNVGGGRPGRIWEVTEEDWDAVVRLNLRSAFLCTRAAVPHMRRQGYGRIVGISSGAREGTPWLAAHEGLASYAAAKAGVHGFTRELALELAEDGIYVNAVAPGPIATERNEPNLQRLEETGEFSPYRWTPLRRAAKPVEVANAVLFLASDEASYITGVTLSVTGGR